MRRLIASHALASIAVGLPWPALLATIWQTTDDPSLLGLAGAARFAPCVLLSAFLGGIGDRFGRFRTVRTVTLLRLPLLAAVAVLFVAGLPWWALAAATATVAAGVPAFPSLAALVPQVADDPDRATDALVTWEISGFVVGPAVGGLLLVFGPAVTASASVLLMAAALLALPRRLADQTASPSRVGLAGGLREVLAVPLVRRAVLTVMALNAVIGALGVSLLSLAETSWGAGVTEFGLATAVLGFASLAAPGLILLLRRLSQPLAAQVAVVLPLLAVAASPGWTLALLPLAVLGAGLTMVECRTTRMLQKGAPVRYVALALGVADAALVGSAMLGALVAPWLIGAVGSAGLLLTMAVATGGVLWWGLGLRPVEPGRGVADDRGLQHETELSVQGDRGIPVVLHGQVDVVLRRGGDDPAADRDQQAQPRPGTTRRGIDRDEVEVAGTVRLNPA